MQLNVLRSTTEMVSLTGEWNHLLVNSAIHVPFLRSEYMINWWRTLGGGEWSHGDLYVVTSRQADGELDGVAPLFYSEIHFIPFLTQHAFTMQNTKYYEKKIEILCQLNL